MIRPAAVTVLKAGGQSNREPTAISVLGIIPLAFAGYPGSEAR
jgi:hypothetical protein